MNEEKRITKEEYLKERMIEMKKLSNEELQTRINLGNRALEFVNTEYWTELKAKLDDKIKTYEALKSGYSFADRHVNREGVRNEMIMIQFEAQVNAFIDIFDQIQFHISDGKLAGAVLKSKIAENK